MEGLEVGVRRVTEIRTPSLGYRIQRSRAKKESQEAHWSEFRSPSINHKPRRKSVTFSNVISNDKSKTSPSAEIYSLHMGNGRDGEEKDKPACSNKEETIVISEMKEAVHFPTGHENQEVEITLNKCADSVLARVAVPQDNWEVTERFHFAEQMKPIELDIPIKSDTPDLQTIWDQGSTADIQTKPLKDLQNENIQNVTMKRLREIRFSPTTFKRINLSASDLSEQHFFSR
ncbi:uncharacterized protein LOC129714214 [Leucoraja erinacea]|uniref:uncharacterized protein LOC129714214 n=1 Tax=Leucoraja erinaceus TaxID=7782 RepID=UPI002455F5B7|nr:uncharacterized protein LOC129714214 [Leucoraja erinacea]